MPVRWVKPLLVAALALQCAAALAEGAANYVAEWKSLHGLIDTQRYQQVLRLLTCQAQEAVVWRDAVNGRFHAQSGIADAQGRVGFHPNRIQAESMRLDGYTSAPANPWETASAGKAIVCNGRAECSATTTLSRPAGTDTIAVQSFDFQHGVSTDTLLLDGKVIATWSAGDRLPGDKITGDTSTRYTVSPVALHPGDVLKVVGRPDAREPAPIDYVEFIPAS